MHFISVNVSAEEDHTADARCFILESAFIHSFCIACARLFSETEGRNVFSRSCCRHETTAVKLQGCSFNFVTRFFLGRMALEYCRRNIDVLGVFVRGARHATAVNTRQEGTSAVGGFPRIQACFGGRGVVEPFEPMAPRSSTLASNGSTKVYCWRRWWRGVDMSWVYVCDVSVFVYGRILWLSGWDGTDCSLVFSRNSWVRYLRRSGAVFDNQGGGIFWLQLYGFLAMKR